MNELLHCIQKFSLAQSKKLTVSDRLRRGLLVPSRLGHDPMSAFSALHCPVEAEALEWASLSS
jgi:hypothetical protein